MERQAVWRGPGGQGECQEKMWTAGSGNIKGAVFGKEFGFHSKYKELPKYHLARGQSKVLRLNDSPGCVTVFKLLNLSGHLHLQNRNDDNDNTDLIRLLHVLEESLTHVKNT